MTPTSSRCLVCMSITLVPYRLSSAFWLHLPLYCILNLNRYRRPQINVEIKQKQEQHAHHYFNWKISWIWRQWKTIARKCVCSCLPLVQQNYFTDDRSIIKILSSSAAGGMCGCVWLDVIGSGWKMWLKTQHYISCKQKFFIDALIFNLHKK